ncbi:MAG: hypothetical protein IJT97_10420 [Bacteroidaceae bacterium]|nr:hypothetical protein [Bacteroidaceae bacterium]
MAKNVSSYFSTRHCAAEVAELCHRNGRTLPQKWQNYATATAELCRRSGRTV